MVVFSLSLITSSLIKESIWVFISCLFLFRIVTGEKRELIAPRLLHLKETGGVDEEAGERRNRKEKEKKV